MDDLYDFAFQTILLQNLKVVDHSVTVNLKYFVEALFQYEFVENQRIQIKRIQDGLEVIL